VSPAKRRISEMSWRGVRAVVDGCVAFVERFKPIDVRPA
jgi:hypothetical protein